MRTGIARAKRVKWVLLLVVAMAVVAIAGCSRPTPSGTGGAPTAVKIGALLALTGSGANYGKSLRNGIEIARDEINRSGGINGRPLEVVYEDSQGDAKTGLAGFDKLVNVDKVPVVLGSISSVILAVAPVADRKQVVFLNSSAISPKICEAAGNYLFSIMPSGAQESEFMAKELARRHKGQLIAVLYSNNSSGVGTKDAFVPAMQAAGGKIAAALSYELGATDFRTQLAKIKASGAKACYLIAFSSKEWADILNQAKQLGLSTQWYSYSGIETDETLRLAGTAANGIIYSYPAYQGTRALMDKFQDAYRAKHGTWADIYTVTSYDGMMMLASVMRKDGITATAIRDGLRRAGAYSGIFGEIRFNKKQYVDKPLLLKTVRKQRFETL